MQYELFRFPPFHLASLINPPANLPSNLNNQVLSVRLNPTGGTFYCRLYK
jgi:hypothetical protein